MKEIRAKATSIRELLGGEKFAIEYYQREYLWETKQVSNLVEDLTEAFQENHESQENHERGKDRTAVKKYGHYFLGSVIINDDGDKKWIIDGQQRLTSMTLLLIYLYHKLTSDDQKGQIADLIFSQKYGERSFNLDIPERAVCMEGLYSDGDFNADKSKSESVKNIVNRYGDIKNEFPEEIITNVDLPYFVDWLIENVQFVEITTFSDADAYTIFESTNDRGLRLTPTDMLKGYLLANIEDPERRNKANLLWKERVASLKQIWGWKEEDADAIKAWLRGKYAIEIRERTRGAEPRDFDLIGTEFHRWVRDHREDLGLLASENFGRFIEEDFEFYSGVYGRIRKAVDNITKELEPIYYIPHYNFTLQYPVLLAPIEQSDTEDNLNRKLRIVARYLGILIARRIWHWKAIDYSTLSYNMFQLVKEIRSQDIPDLVRILIKRLDEDENKFTSNGFSLHSRNGPPVHLLLARFTDYVETQSGKPSLYYKYIQRGEYQIEHIWANHHERHKDEFSHPADFHEYRNRLGALLLLPKSQNASFGDKPYSEKRELYLSHSENLLAKSLHEGAYKNNPGFRKFCNESALPFEAHSEFKKKDVDARQELYLQLAKQIWSPDTLKSELE